MPRESSSYEPQFQVKISDQRTTNLALKILDPIRVVVLTVAAHDWVRSQGRPPPGLDGARLGGGFGVGVGIGFGSKMSTVSLIASPS